MEETKNGILGKKTVYAVLALAAVAIFYFLYKSGDTNDVQVEHGAGQRSSAMEQELENRNIIMQVVQATEEIERHPDPAYLRNAIGRLDSWLGKQPKTKSFMPDPQFEQFSRLFEQLSVDFREADTIILKFMKNDKSKLETADGDKLLEYLGKILTGLNEVGKIHAFPVFEKFIAIVDDFQKRLKDSAGYQFGDRIGLMQTAIQKFEMPSWFRFARAAQDFETLRVLMKSDIRSFNPEDADFLMQSVWMRNIATWAKGKKQDDFLITLNLFDWTVKNVAIKKMGMNSPLKQLIPQHPWQTILTSQGTAMERAMVFMELLRQNRIDSFILRPEKNVPENFPVIIGVLLNNDVYLFLSDIGLPVPAKNGLKLENGLTFSALAPLSQILTDDSILRQLDLSEKEKFPLSADQLRDLVAYVPTNPFVMAERMALMETEFSGSNEKSAEENDDDSAKNIGSAYTVLYLLYPQMKEKIARIKGISKVEHFWEGYNANIEQIFLDFESQALVGPYYYTMKEGTSIDPQIKENKSDQYRENKTEAEDIGLSAGKKEKAGSGAGKELQVKHPPLWIGKVLYFKGSFTNERGAAHWLQQGQTSDRQLKQMVNELDQRTMEYVKGLHEQSAKAGRALSPDELKILAAEFQEKSVREVAIRRYIKTTSRFYLGLLSNEAGNYDTAINHLSDPILRNELSALWMPAAFYLIARTYEAKGDYSRAIGVLNTVESPMKYGSLLRAKWLMEVTQNNKSVILDRATPATAVKTTENKPAAPAPANIPSAAAKPATPPATAQPASTAKPAVKPATPPATAQPASIAKPAAKPESKPAPKK